ncbi:glutathione S-transferase [Bacterioplanes sanyensis]|uniref:Glutathione S-transferase n=1 Tax=Bacterioplanes sanyensis TaxID=1249553 RepID=A0A222FP82_9GAMM|nr:glutathione S-transferase family protein [Bacterioplanes sanyensis]ASP40522.1 glutathione S-transferase [Bacterioplanes sanyensis]
MKLYSARRAPSPRRTLMLLAEKDLQLDIIYLDLADGENLRPPFIQHNPMAKVPLLQLDDGSYLSEAAVINRYLDEYSGSPLLTGVDAASRARIDMWDRRVEFGFMLPVAHCFQHTSGYFADRMTPVPAYGEVAGQQARDFLAILQQQLQHHEYVAGDAFSVADITAVCALDFARVVKIKAGEEHPAIHAWYQRMQQRPSYSVEY